MKDELPYEELIKQRLEDIPLPDEDMAWEDMRRRLEEDKERRIIPFWLNGCLGWGLIGLLVIGLSWWIFRPDRWFDSGSGTEKVSQQRTVDRTGVPDSLIKTVLVNPSESNDTGDPDEPTTLDPIDNHHTDNDKLKTGQVDVKTIRPSKLQKTDKTERERKISKEKNRKKENKEEKENRVDDEQREENENRYRQDSLPKNVKPVLPANNTDTVSSSHVSDQDTVSVRKKDSSAISKSKTDSSLTKKKEDSTKKKSFSVSIGAGIYQQLPVAGQSWIPYNALGRKGTLMDYIPSLTLRLNREDKWFFQSEFRYGAPQLNKEQLYSQQTDTNQATQKVNINSSTVRKTYYHQVPLTFNYYVLPGLAIGGGMTWNRFYSAVSENEIMVRDLNTGLDTILIPAQTFRIRKADSNFVKSFWQAVFETSYRRRKFSAGLRYSFGLQPFIRFDLPGLPGQSMKNSSFQLFLRYELWRSRKKENK